MAAIDKVKILVLGDSGEWIFCEKGKNVKNIVKYCFFCNKSKKRWIGNWIMKKIENNVSIIGIFIQNMFFT